MKNAKRIVALLTMLTLVLGCSTMAEAATSSAKIITHITDRTSGKYYSSVPVISGHEIQLKITVKTSQRTTMRLKVPGCILKGSSQSLSLTVREKGRSARSVHKIKILKSVNDCQLANDAYLIINGKKLGQAQAAHIICGKASLRLPKGKSSIVVRFRYGKTLEPEPPEKPEPPKLSEESDEPIGPCEGCREHFKEIWGYHAAN